MDTETRRDTLQSRGYHMTEENVQELQDKALGQYMRLKANLNAATERLQQTGSQMADLGRDLASKPAAAWLGFVFKPYPWLNPDAIATLVQDVQRAQNESESAHRKVIDLGIAVPIDRR